MRNKKGKKIIKPAGSELMDYLNRGYAICNRCGAVMDRREDPEGGCDIYTCPSCRPPVAEPAEARTLTAKHRARCLTTKHYQRGGGAP